MARLATGPRGHGEVGDGSFFSTRRIERTARKLCRTRYDARADVFDDIERFYNPRRRHSKLGLPQPNGVRGIRHASLTWCPRNRQQLTVRCKSIRTETYRPYPDGSDDHAQIGE